jgi:hypothetical protein
MLEHFGASSGKGKTSVQSERRAEANRRGKDAADEVKTGVLAGADRVSSRRRPTPNYRKGI